MQLLFLSFFFLSNSSPSCLIPNCESCSYQSAEICINCNAGYYRDELEGCVKTDDDNSIRIENCEELNSYNKCRYCRSGYILLNGRCEPECFPDCICFNPLECLSGTDGNGKYERGGHDGHDHDDGRDGDHDGDRDGDHDGDRDGDHDQDHDENEYDSESEYSSSASCTYGCKTCALSGLCTECDSGFQKIGGSCQESRFSDCDEGYFFTSGSCEKCIENCGVCYNYYTCSECKSGYSNSNDECKKSDDKESKLAVVIAVPISCGVGLLIIVSVVCCVIKKKQTKALKSANFDLSATPDFYSKTPVSPALVVEESRYPYLPQAPPGSAANRMNIEPSAPSFGVSNSQVMIGAHNFLNVVPLVNLDNSLKFFEQDNCVICKENFSLDQETRSLPCMHAFHGKCIYDTIVIGNQKTCPICRREYL